MRFSRIALLLLSISLVFSAPATAQVCGDADSNGVVSLGDLSVIMWYIVETTAPPDIIYEEGADCDSRTGIAPGDATAIVRRIFGDFAVPQCPPTMSYTFPAAPNDTIFIPHWDNIPESVDRLELPVELKFTTPVRALYMGLQSPAVGPGSNFALDSLAVTLPMNGFSNENYGTATDTLLAYVFQTEETNQPLTLIANRRTAGVGDFNPAVADRNSLIRACIVGMDGETYIPVFAYYDYEPPPPVLQVTPAEVDLAGEAGYPADDTVTVTFTSDSELSIEFTLTWASEWLEVIGYSGPMTTPASVQVTGDALMLPAGFVYTDALHIDLTEPGSAETPVTDIPVTYNVREPQVLPPGDLNCDGAVTLADLVVLINYLFINPGPIPPCD